MAYDGKVWHNPDPPEAQARVGTGLKNLHHWRGMIGYNYQGPWPSPADFMDDARYQAFIREMPTLPTAKGTTP